MKKSAMMTKRLTFAGLLGLSAWAAAPAALAQSVSLTVSGPSQAANCGVVYVTNRFANTGATVSGLWMTNELPSSSYAYVPGLSTVTLPGGIVLTGAAADPDVNNGSTNLTWDFTAVVTPSAITNLLITEVFYNPGLVPEDDNEWVELYNPTTNAVDLTGWSLRDTAPGAIDVLPALAINPGEFVVVAADTNAFLAANPAYAGVVVEVADGKIGSGLNNFGDGVILRNAASATVDAVSYGASTAAFSPAVPTVAAGSSIERNPANNDTNARNDWRAQATPNPGTGTLPVGIQSGGAITVVYAVEINCDAVSGRIFSRTGFEQPPGTPHAALGSMFLTLNEPDLVVTKTPIMQDGGVGDTVTWTVRVENAGFGGAENVVAVDNLGPGLVFTGFGVAPTTLTASNATWDATAIAAFTNLAEETYVDIVVTAEVVSCAGLYNRADAQWSCGGMAVLPNETCEDTSLINETATAGIRFVDRYPSVTVSLDPNPLDVSYCGGGALTLYITNAAGADVGYADNFTFTPTLPAGWSLSGANVDTNGIVQVGRLPAGVSTSVTVLVEAGGTCPIVLTEQGIYFQPDYADPCGNPFTGPVLATLAAVVDEPLASVTKIMPGSVSGDDGSFPVRIELAYENFVGTESIVVTDLYPVHTNLTVANVSAGGAQAGNAIEWTIVPGAGSGVVTASFDMVIGTPCGGPSGIEFNEVQASDYVDCLGCTRTVAGDGFRFPLQFNYGVGCPQEPGLTGGCSFVSSKDVFPALTEVCDPALATHTFTAFGGTLGDWTGVTFTADLAGGNGTVDTTNDVTVLIDGSNVTSYVSISQSAPSLVVDLSGLNGSSFPGLGSVTASLVVAYPVSVDAPGQYTDNSSLFVPGCGTANDEVVWNVGGSQLEIELEQIFIAQACGRIPGSIGLEMIPSPEGVSGETGLFPAYDVAVTLDMDFDGDAQAGFSYIPGTTTFSNIVDLAGTPVPAFEPAISGNQLIWDLGDLGTNTGMSIHYLLRPSCSPDTDGLRRADVAYNARCAAGSAPALSAVSQTNVEPFFVSASLVNSLQPELQFLTDTQIVNQIRILNTGEPDAYNLRIEMDLPPGVSFGAAEIPPTSITATQVVWSLHTSPFHDPALPLYDDDMDGSYDDLRAREVLEFWVTNHLDDCTTTNELVIRSSHGCKGESCSFAPESRASFASISGSLVTRATFPVENDLCEVNPVEYSVRNSGLTVDYEVETRQTLPAGMSYVPGSSEVSLNGGTTNAIADPAGSGLPGDPLVWDEGLIPLLAAMQPNDQVTIYYEVALGCDVVTGDNRFIAEGAFTDLCGNRVTNREVVSVLSPNEPLLEVTKTSALDAADLGETNVYTITIRHDAASAADVPYLVLTDVLPAAIAFAGASVTPDAVIGQTLIWSNATLNAQVGDLAAPFAVGEGTITILVTGIVNDCAASVINSASVDYGCSESDACLTASDSASLITTPRLTPPGLVSAMTLDTCGGTKTVSLTNSGASTESDVLYVEYAPPGYIFTGATASGEFTSAGLTVAYSGTPVGSIATVDFSTDVASGATDAKDDIGDGLNNLELGKNSGFAVIWTLASTGDNLDCLADPTDLDYEDPEQGDPTSLMSSNLVTYTDLCGEPGSAVGSNSAFPGIPDLDIDLQPNSLIVNAGDTVVFTLNVVNNSETTDGEGIFVRVKMGEGWTNVTYLSSNIVSSGATAMDREQQGDTNLLFNFPGVVLNPLDDEITVTFRADVTQNGGPLTAVAEVVGDCGNGAITPACVFTNAWGEAPLANSMTGSVIAAVNGQYYSFDQDRFAAAGHTLSKTVRYDEEAAGAAGTTRRARVGEDLIYRIEALYFGGEFSAVTIADSLPPELAFGTPTGYAFSGGITGAVWDAGSGVFTLQPAVLATNPSTFAVDIPVVASNRLDVQDGAVITNVATTDFTLDGVTNVPVERMTEVEIYEPVLQLTKTVNSNLVQAGDVVIFTNRLVHTGASRTSAYSVVFTDTLPAGLVFHAFISPASGTVAGQTVSFNTNDLAALGEFAPGDPAIDFVFSARVADQLVGATITNQSTATYVSLDDPSENGNERDGSDGVGGLNDYVTSSSVALASLPLKAIAKTFVSSSQTNTLDGTTNDWTIGERFVYQIRIDVPQGVVSNLLLTDTIPAGIDWVGTNPDAALAYPGRGYEFEIPAGGPQFPTNAGAGLSIGDTDPTPASSVLQDGSGRPVTFTFAAITNAADGNLANDYFLLRMEFVALTNASNAGIGAGATRGSNVVSATDAFATLGATGPVYRIVEHDVRAQKIRSPATADAGDVMTFTVVASNQVNALANAYDVMVSDTLSSNVYDFATFSFGAVTPGWATELIGTSGGRIFRMYSVPDTALVPNSGATGVFTVALAQGVRPNQIYTNRMDVTNSTTLYGPPPGGIAERNDTANNSVTFNVPGLALAKTFETTSETNLPPDSTGSTVQIGEVLTYRLAVTLPESTITNLTVVDRISTNGLAYVYGSARLDTSTSFVGNVGSFVESPTAAPPAYSAMGQTMTFTFTNVVVTGDNYTTNNTFYLLLDYLVLNNATNRGLAGGQTVHTNQATLTYSGNPGGAVTSAVVTTTVIEPRLTLAKNVVQANVDAGDVVDVLLTVTNSGLATAYDVAITDLLDTVYFDPATVTDAVAPTGFVFGLAGNALTIRSDTNSPTGTNTIEAGEFLQFSFKVAMSSNMPPLLTATNVATLNWDSLRSTNFFDVQRSYATNASDTIAGLPWSFAKTFVGTSENNNPPDSTTTNVQIGEVVTYQLDLALPEGTVSNLTFRDFVPAGMAFVVGSVVVDTSSFNGTLPAGPTVTPNAGALGADGGTVTIEFLGDTVVAGDNVPGNNTLSLRLEALVLDAASVSGLAPQTLLTNRADVTYFNNPLGPSNSLPVVVQAIEPRLRIFKSLTPTNDVSADDVLSITLVVTNAGTATAYDVAVEDVFDPLIYDLGELANVVLPTGFVHEVVGNAFRILSDTNAPTGTNTIEAGETLTFTFDVGVANTLAPNVTVTNFATVTGDSLARTNVFDVERDTGDTNSAIFVAEDFEPSKLLIATSETGPADSTGANLQIGEVATYEVTVELPDLTITNLTIRDDLPAGMAYVVGSLQILTNAAPGQFAAATNVAPSAGPLGASGEDLVVVWEGNTLLEHQSGGADPVLVLRYDAVILDLPANAGLVPQTVLTNRASVTYAGNPNPPATVVGPPVALIEPQLAISKTMSPDNGDAGDEITVTLVATNSGLATAYDVRIEDVLDGTIFNVDSVTNVSMPAGFAFTLVPGPADVAVRYASDLASGQPTNTLEVGESLEFVFTVHLAQAVEPDGRYTNTVSLAADTIYETNAVGIQRSYTNESQVPCTIPNISLQKSFVGTSETGPADTAGKNVTIGEVVTYALEVRLPESTVTNLTVTDLIPAGMSYVAGSVVVDTAGFGGTLPGAPAVATGGGSGDSVTFTFNGLTVVADDNDIGNNVLTIELQLLTLDVADNDGLPPAVDGDGMTELWNTATVAYGGYPPVTNMTGILVNVVEPRLAITKTMAEASNSVVVIDLVVTNRGLATAFDVEIEDVLSTTWWDTDTIVPVTVPDGFTFGFAGNPGNATITIASDPASQQPTNSIEVGESLLFQFRATLIDGAPSPVTNEATVTEHSTLDGPDPEERDEPPVEDEDVLEIPGYTLIKTLTSPLGRAAQVGETVTFDLVVANTGAIGLDPVPLEDSYDTTFLSYVGAVPASEDNANDGTINWTNVGPLAVGDSVTVAVEFVAIESTQPGDTTNRVVASPFTTNGLPLLPKTNEAPVEAVYVGYTLAKDRTSPAGRAAQVGEPIVFSITVVNTGEVELATVPVEDVYDTTYLIYGSSVPASDDNANDGTLNWADVGPLPVGASTTIVATFTAAASTLGLSETNVVATTPTTPPTAPPVFPKTNDAPYEISSAGYSLAKDRTSPVGRAAQVGETITFEILVTNTGEVELATVPVEDVYDATYLTYGSSVPASDDNANDGTLNWTDVGPLPVGASTTIVATFTAAASTLGLSETNVVATTPTTPPTAPPVFPKTNDAPYEISSAGYTLAKDRTSPVGRAAQIGEAITFEILVTNTGDVELATVPVEDVYDTTYLSYVSSVPASDDNANDGTLNWADVGPLPVGASTTIVATFTAAASTLGLSETNVVATAPTTPPTAPPVPPQTNDAPYEISSAGYTLAKDRTSPVGRPAIIGETVTFEILVTNTGEVELVTVPVEDTYETAYLTYVSSLPASDDNANDGTINWADVGPLPVGASTTIVATFTGAADTLGADRTNGVATTPTTPPTAPPVPPQTNDAPYAVDSPASLGNFVWLDVNGDGLQGGASETGMPDVVVTLYDFDDAAIGTTTTDVAGAYAFTNLVPGDYHVRFTLPPGYSFTLQNQGGDAALDSDADPATGHAIPTTLVSGENDLTWDAGLYVAASLGNFVWNDLDADGIQDGGETGVVGVVVNLLTNGTVMATTTTDVNGAYAFVGLPPWDYQVQVVPPAGWYVSPQNQGMDDAADSDVDVATGLAATTTLDSGESDPTWDAGLYLPAGLGDLVWLDVDGDGVQGGAGETGMPDVVVTLYDATDIPIGTTTTDVSGAYAFTNLVPGTYYVGFAPPAGYQITLLDQGGDALDSDADRTTGLTAPTVLISGENDPMWDAGLYVPASLGDFVWNDLNADGVQDGGETGIVGVVVTLYSALDDSVVGVTTTDVAGAYAFTNLIPGAYYVGVAVPGGWYVSPQDQAGDAQDSDVDVAMGLTATITLVSGQNDPDWDAGLFLPASLGDYVWEDVDGNGVQEFGEPAISNVVVTLYDAATNALGVTTTDVAGAYAFTNLVPGTYFVGFAPPAGWQITLRDRGGDDALDSDADQTTGFTVPTTLISGENDPTWDAGLYRPASLGDFVWDDLNADGIQDGDETGVSTVTVNLLTNGTIIATTTTDANGLYAFTNLPPWDYQVQVVAPAGWYVSPQDQLLDDAADSDVDVATGLTATITLVSGQNDPDWDAGLYLPASLGDFVWLDVDGDGIQDAGEAGLPNILVDLYAAGGGFVASTTTDVNGAYAFTNLVPGDYYIDVDVPAGWFTSPPNQGGDGAQDSDIDSAGSTATTTLASGENDPTWDAGLSLPASLGDFVWEDRDGDGIQDAGEPGIPNVTVRLYDAVSNLVGTTTTDANGLYAFTDLPAGPYYVNFVRPAGYRPSPADRGADDAADSDANQLTGNTVMTALLSGENDPTWDAGFFRPASVGDYVWLDENWDGVQDPGEAGLPNVRVQLLNSTGTVVATTLTDVNGLYLFSDLPPGSYTVRVDVASLPAGLAANQTFDPDATRNHQTTVTLASGDAIRTADFGYNWRPPTSVLGAIGDRVWADADADGVQDPGEPGIPGVRMLLYVDSNGDGTYNSQVASVLTDASGFYIFTNLAAGSYQVRVATNTLPAGYVQSGDPDHFGADATANPSQAGDHRTTTPIVLAPGDVFVNADFGYLPPTFSNLGDLIYFDANANGAYSAASGDYGIPGVTVALLNGAGQIIASTVTDSAGGYLFTGLPAGTYTVWVNDSANVLGNLVQTGDPDGGLDSRSTTTLDGRHDDLLQDHGYTPDGHGPLLGLIGDTIFLDRDGNGLPGTGEGIQGVTVRLYDSPGFALLATTVTDPNGRYYFGGLPAMSYTVRVDTNTLPNGGVGLVNTVDPDTANPGNSQSLVTIGPGGINLLQDFGYVPSAPNAIGGTLWKDCNADGTLDSDETPRWQGIQVVLRDSSGNVVGTTFTDATGTYRFARLPAGTYTVGVNDVSNRMHGFWASVGPNPGADNNSQREPYAITVGGGQTNTTGDFGFFQMISELGDYVWYDINGNGLQDGGEPGLAGVKVTLKINYPNGNQIVMQTLTDSSGRYRFANLLQDERYRETTTNSPATVGLPRFQISIVGTQAVLTADGYDPTSINAGNGANDSRRHAGVFALLALCGRTTVYDFGYKGGPLLAVIGNVDAFTRDGQTVVRWETIESWGTAGFWLERQVGEEWVRISQELLPFPLFGVAPIVYEEIDPSAEPGGTYRYRLVELENDGDILYYGPYELTVDGPGRTYDDWAAVNFTAEELADPSISGRDADPDGDGLTNEQEFLAGTDPKSADSVLQINQVRRVADGFELRWKTVPGRFYKIAVADSLFGPFLPLEGSILATAEIETAIVDGDFSGRQMFFQVIRVDGP